MTDDMEDCTFQITNNNSYRYISFLKFMFLYFSYCAAFFRQLHAFLQKTLKSSLRIHTGGLMIVNLIINIGDIMAFLTVVVKFIMIQAINLLFFSVLQSTKLPVRADKGKANMQTKEPSEFLKNAIGKNVRVKLNSGFSYKGFFKEI